MNVLVFNVGSTTLKFACIDAASGDRLIGGNFENIGRPGGDSPDHLSAARDVLDRHKHIDLAGIGHRIVQGGDRFSNPTPVRAGVLDHLAELDRLAPLHNPPARAVVEAIAGLGITTPQVMVFDTAFYSTLPEQAYRYAIGDDLFRRHGVRRYGMHGTSHQFVVGKTINFLAANVTQPKIISLHLGGGASATASIGGIAVETSMGMTPLEGLVMATRCGDIDPSLPTHLIQHAGMSAADVDHALNRESGLRGLCGETDMRTILDRRAAGDAAAAIAIAVYVHRLQKYIGAYFAILGGLDAIVFTAGVGENAPPIRAAVADSLGHLGITVDQAANRGAGERKHQPVIDISATDAAVKTLVVPTDEELAIARQTASVLA